jgi:hypothetical protein
MRGTAALAEWGLWELNLNPVPIIKLIRIAQPNVGSDLDNVPRVMSDALFILIRAQQECLPAENPAGYDTHRYASAILIRFEPDDVSGQ